MKTQALTDRQQEIWNRYQRMRARLGERLNRELARETGLSEADFEILAHLTEVPGESARAIALRCGLEWEKSRLSHQLRRMEQRGLLERSECPTDGRGAFVSLTPEGRAAIEAAAPRHVAEVRRHFVDVLTPEQLDVLGDIAEAVLESLQQAEQPTG